MPITTKEEVKELLQIPAADTSKDILIDSLIVKVQDFIIRRINNFAVPYVYAECYGLTFTASDKSINSNSQQFLESGLDQGNNILVSGTYQNNKLFSIATITDNKITVNETVVNEESSLRVIIHKVEFTEDIKLATADFIAFKMNKEKTVKSRSLGDHSESFFTQQEMLAEFSSFRKLQWD
ncbi:MAG: hypothetical protein KGZ85_08010 [Ignavibacterium sp.]|nr:hypothetical protein [Ignavibacterium sp.]